MQACTRCGHWHTDAEKHMGRYLSCTEAKAFWSDLKRRHMEQAGHMAMIKISSDGRVRCVKCNQELNGTP